MSSYLLNNNKVKNINNWENISNHDKLGRLNSRKIIEAMYSQDLQSTSSVGWFSYSIAVLKFTSYRNDYQKMAWPWVRIND